MGAEKNTVRLVRELNKRVEGRATVLIVFDEHGGYSISEYASTKADCAKMAKWVDHLFDGINSGRIRDPWEG
jgi:serine/threonine protein phosphatase PrpC